MIIRPAVASDRYRIWPMLEHTFRAGDTYAIAPDIRKEEALAYWVDSPAVCFVAEDSGELVGTFYIRANQPGGGSHVCNCGYIVNPSQRGKGIAAAMCEKSQLLARELGFSAMQFNFVLASNTAAVGLWKRLGFAVVGQLPHAFDHPELGLVDAFVMHKHLAA